MKIVTRISAAVLVRLCLTAAPLMAGDKHSCELVAQSMALHAFVNSAESVPTGSLVLPPNALAIENPSETPEFCRVKGTLKPTSDSSIGFEVWLPASGWSGRFVQVGNGGLAGSINSAQMLHEIVKGNATASTDDGHQGLPTDGSWAQRHPERVKDFGYRAVHETSEIAKKIIAEYYGASAKYSYFNGCSEGGREALMEAQRYPQDFNGILAGAPAHYWTSMMAAFVWNAQALSDPAHFIPEPKRKIIEDAALRACETSDDPGATFIQSPLACHFDPSVLLCKVSDADNCLTAPQIEAMQKIYSGPKNPRTGEQISPGYEPGAEAEPGMPGLSFSSYVFGMGPGRSLNAMFSTAFYGSFVFENPTWKFTDLNFDKDIAVTEEKVGAILNASDPDLSSFKEAGGKLLQYHGWYDGSPSPLHSVQYFEKVEEKMGGGAKVQGFYRLYMVPGMMHCATGPGPNAFGNAFDPSPGIAPEHNIFVALEQWVEKGVAPGPIVATKHDNDDPKKGTAMTRPLCPYPQIAAKLGGGAATDARNWSCTLPPAVEKPANQ